MRSVNVKIADAGLYGVFVGEMLGQFSDGFWEKSRYHVNDWKVFGTNSTFLTDETPEELPTIRYDIAKFFAYVKKENIDCIILRVLMIYNHADLIKKVYDTEGKEAADRLIELLSNADFIDGIEKIRNEDLEKGKTEETSHYITRYNLVIKYFGSFDNFRKNIPDAENAENIKKFRKIGTALNKQFNHVKDYYDLDF